MMGRRVSRRATPAASTARIIRPLDGRKIVIDLDALTPIAATEAAAVETFLDDELRRTGVYGDSHKVKKTGHPKN